MIQEKIMSIQGAVIYTTGGQRIAIGNENHKPGDWVWVEGNYVFGHSRVVNCKPYLSAEGDTILYATENTISAVRIASGFQVWQDIKKAYNGSNCYFCYSPHAVCIVIPGSFITTWWKKHLDGTTQKGYFESPDATLVNAQLNAENKLQGMFVNSQGVYSFIDNEVSVLSAGFPTASITPIIYDDLDKYDYVHFASDEKRYYDRFLQNKILISQEVFAKFIINEEIPLEEWYKEFLTTDGSKKLIGDNGIDVAYSFVIAVHANYYVEWVNDGSAFWIEATSIKFKSNDGKVDTDITQYVHGRYIELLNIMPVLVIRKNYMLLRFGDYLALFDRAGKFIASQTYGTARMLEIPFLTKKAAGKLMELLR